jgi:4'-phosphopantetheinyl transferase
MGDWFQSPVPPTLGPDEVHVWKDRLDRVSLAEREAALSPEEHRRAGAMLRESARRRFVAARGGLRLLLAAYGEWVAKDLVFAYGDTGKPRLATPCPEVPLSFNLSHSGDWILYAFAHNRAVGVDIEEVKPRENADALVRRFFAPAELAAWENIPPLKRTDAFFAGWTRKEAYVKARGEGVLTAFSRFGVDFGSPARLLFTDGDDPARWTLVDLAPGPGYVGALAAEGRDLRICLFHASP